MAPAIGDDFVAGRAHRGRRRAGDRRLPIFPHLDHEDLPENTMADAERWRLPRGPAYAIDDQTAIKVTDGDASGIRGALEAVRPLTPGARRALKGTLLTGEGTIWSAGGFYGGAVPSHRGGAPAQDQPARGANFARTP